MPKFIIIISTAISSPFAIRYIAAVLKKFKCVNEWSIDLQDNDNVLRVSANTDIGSELVASLLQSGVAAAVMGIFDPEGNEYHY